MSDYPTNPDAGYKSFRDFKTKKRRAVRKAMDSMEDLYLGCAYLPDHAYKKVVEVRKLLESIKEDLSIKKYGR